MKAPSGKDLYLVELRAENWKRFSCFLLHPDGKHAIIRGKNTSGKTSAVQALDTLLRGAQSRAVPDPIRHGEDKATLTCDLGEVTIRRTITEDGKRQVLDLRAADGTTLTRPQQLLDELRGNSFDIVCFMSARPQDQVDAVLHVCEVQPPVVEVRKATGEDCPARDGESADAYLGRLSADETGLFFVKRRDANRVAAQKRKALAEQEEVVKSFGPALEGGDLSAGELLARLQELQVEEDARRAAETDAAAAKAEHGQKASVLKGLETAWGQQVQRVEYLEKQLAEARFEEKALW